MVIFLDIGAWKILPGHNYSGRYEYIVSERKHWKLTAIIFFLLSENKNLNKSAVLIWDEIKYVEKPQSELE